MARPRSPRGISIVAGKNVSLVGFGSLDKAELNVIKQIMPVYINKIEERTDYTELRIRLKSHQHIKSFMHELEADLFIPGTTLSVKANHKNLNRALALVMTKLLSKIEHLKKKGLRERPVRKLTKRL